MKTKSSESVPADRVVVPKAVIFDFDGVILESAEIKTEAFLELFAGYPAQHDAILRHHIENLGISRYRKFEWIYRELLDEPLDEDLSRSLGERFSVIVLEKILACSFVPGAIELLEILAPRIPLFVASGTPQEELETVVAARGIGGFFREIWGTPLSKIEIIKSIMTRYSLSAPDVVFIGDGISDYRAAKETGVSFLARETPQVDIDWRALGAPMIPDLAAAPPLLGLAALIR